jgi:hypothetical protein
MDHIRSSFSLLLVALFCTACIGTIGDEPGADVNGTGGAGAAGGGVNGAGQDPAGFVPAPASLRRLTRGEYTSSVQDLLGNVTVPPGLEGDLFDQGFSTVGATKSAIGDVGTGKFDEAALDLAHQVFGDTTRRASFVGCAPANASDPCVRTFVQSFGRRAFRRPLAPDEIDRYAGVVTAAAQAFANDVWAGLEYATATFLESPYFLYRAELGEPDPSRPGARRYTSYEMAARLSFFLWGTTPDGALLDAAERGELVTQDGVGSAATRLLASPRADAALLHFFDEHFSLAQLDVVAKDKTVYPTFTPALAAAMRTETEMMIKDTLLDHDGDLRTLFDTPSTFLNADLAKFYGISGVQGSAFVRATLPASGPRAGLVTTAGILTLNARNGRTSPTLRGLFITNRLLCWEPGDPPPNVNQNALDDDAGAKTWTTMRQRLEAHRANPVCAGCHKVLDPPGLALEHFDGIGAYRETDHGVTLDVSGDLFGGTPFDGAKGLAAALKQDPRLADCFARQLYRYATGHREVPSEDPILKQLASDAASSGLKLRALAKALVASDGFRFAADPR